MTPASEAELADVIRDAQGPFAVTGGGTRGVSCGGATLSTAGLTGITLYEPGALTLVVRTGTPLAKVEDLLAAEGQRLAFEPCDLRRLLGTVGASTIGGVVATNASGPRRIQVGACRDHLLGVRFVDGLGQIVKNGGRVMKNVTGYDLVKLLAGSHGTLGVLTEVSLKVLPRAQAVATLVRDEPDAGRAAAVMAAALGSPFDVTGAAWVAGRVLIRLEGFAASVDDRAARLGATLGAERAEVDWDAVRDVHVFADRPGDVWRVSVRPSALAATVAALQAGGLVDVAADWGGGLIWVLCHAGRDLRRDLAQGHATRVRGAALADLPRFQPEAAPLAAISADLRQRFDPRGILNQGVMG